MKIGAIYGRSSDEETAERDLGSLVQQEHMGFQQARFLSETTGEEHIIKDVLIEDKAVTGGHTNRPKYQQLLDLIRTRRIDFFVAKEVSRLNRSTIDFCELMTLCKDNEVAVHIRGLNLDPRNPMHDAMFKILAVIAELERKMIQERTRSSIRSAMINNAKIPGGRLLLGFDKDPDRIGFWLPNDGELRLVKLIMKKFLEVQSYKELRTYITRLSYKNKYGEPFKKNAFKRILTNTKYIGKMRVPGDKEEWVDLPFGAVIPVDLFDEVQKQVRAIEETPKNLRNRKRVYLLSGLLIFEDGSKFTGKSGRGRLGDVHYYYVNAQNKITLQADQLELVVINSLRVYQDNTKMIQYASELEIDRNAKQEMLRQQVESIRRELRNVEA